jgi:hypothetical protein
VSRSSFEQRHDLRRAYAAGGNHEASRFNHLHNLASEQRDTGMVAVRWLGLSAAIDEHIVSPNLLSILLIAIPLFSDRRADMPAALDGPGPLVTPNRETKIPLMRRKNPASANRETAKSVSVLSFKIWQCRLASP